MREAAVAGDRLERVADRVAEVQHAAQPALALVLLHHLGLDPAGRGDRVLHRHPVPAAQARRGLADRGEERAVAEDRALEDLVGARAELADRQRRQERGIDDHRARLVEGPDHVLGLRVVDAHLAADRAVDHGEQSGRDAHPVDAAHPGRGGEAREVAHDAAPEGDDEAVAAKASLEQGVVDRLQRGAALEPLAVGDEDDVDGAEGAQGALDTAAVQRGDAAAGHEQDLPTVEAREEVRQQP